jgi:hypothetical protein
MDFREIYTYMYIVETLQIWLKSEKNLGLILEYLSTLVLVLHLHKSAKENHCCIYMPKPEHFYILDYYVYVTNNTR